MDNKKYANAQEYIEKKYIELYGIEDKSYLPSSIMDNFDPKLFSQHCVYKDVYDILMNCNPFEEISTFLNSLNKKDYDNIKRFSFDNTDAIIKKHNLVLDTIIDDSFALIESLDPNDHTDNKKETDKNPEFEIISYVDFQYKHEAERITDLLSSALDKGKSIVSFLNSTGEIPSNETEVLQNIFSDMLDQKNVIPDNLLVSALNIFKQTHTFVMSDDAFNNINSLV